MKPRRSRGIILVIVAGFSFWLLDALVDIVLFWKAPFTELPNAKLAIHAAYSDVITLIYLVIFVVVLLKYVRKFNESESRYQQLFDSVDDLIFIQSPVTSDDIPAFSDGNLAACRKLGYSHQELLQLTPANIIPPMKLGELSASMKELLEKKHILYETIHVAKDGLELPVEINAHIVDLRGQPAILSIARDITERQRSENALLEAHSQLEKRVEERTRELAQANLELKREVAERTQAEAALRESKQQLQTLTSQILTAEETERQRISRELHDGLGQTLMLLKFKLSSFVDRVCPSKDLICEYAPLFKYLDEVIENLRRLSRDLSTSVLEELGLSSSLRYLLGEFTKHFHIAASSIELDQIDRLFSPETQINIYRIYQEILTNIARHAAARKISVAAAKHDDYVVFVVEDDGLGFDLSQIASRTPPERRVGVAAMQERARISGGSLELWSQEGSGTRVTFKIPIMKHMDEHAAR